MSAPSRFGGCYWPAHRRACFLSSLLCHVWAADPAVFEVALEGQWRSPNETYSFYSTAHVVFRSSTVCFSVPLIGLTPNAASSYRCVKRGDSEWSSYTSTYFVSEQADAVLEPWLPYVLVFGSGWVLVHAYGLLYTLRLKVRQDEAQSQRTAVWFQVLCWLMYGSVLSSLYTVLLADCSAAYRSTQLRPDLGASLIQPHFVLVEVSETRQMRAAIGEYIAMVVLAWAGWLLLCLFCCWPASLRTSRLVVQDDADPAEQPAEL